MSPGIAKCLQGSRVTQLKTDALLHHPYSFVKISPSLSYTHFSRLSHPPYYCLTSWHLLQSFLKRVLKHLLTPILLPVQFPLFSSMKPRFSGFPLHLRLLHFGLLYQLYSLDKGIIFASFLLFLISSTPAFLASVLCMLSLIYLLILKLFSLLKCPYLCFSLFKF